MHASFPTRTRLTAAAAYLAVQRAAARVQVQSRPLLYRATRHLLRIPRSEARCVLMLPTLISVPFVLAGLYLLTQGYWLVGPAGAGLAAFAGWRSTQWLQRLLRKPLQQKPR